MVNGKKRFYTQGNTIDQCVCHPYQARCDWCACRSIACAPLSECLYPLTCSGALLADSPDPLVYPDNHPQAQVLCQVSEGTYQAPDPSKYNRIPPSKRRDASSTRPSSCGRNSSCPTVVVPGLRIPRRDVTPTPVRPDDPAAASSSPWASNLPQVEPVPSTSINLPCCPVPPRSDSDGDINDPEVYRTIGGGHPPTDKEWAKI